MTSVRTFPIEGNRGRDRALDALGSARMYAETRLAVGARVTITDWFDGVLHVGYAVIVETE